MSLKENEEFVSSLQEKFDTFAAKGDWVACAEVIDELEEAKFVHESNILKEALVAAKDEYGRSPDMSEYFDERVI